MSISVFSMIGEVKYIKIKANKQMNGKFFDV